MALHLGGYVEAWLIILSAAVRNHLHGTRPAPLPTQDELRVHPARRHHWKVFAAMPLAIRALRRSQVLAGAPVAVAVPAKLSRTTVPPRRPGEVAQYSVGKSNRSRQGRDANLRYWIIDATRRHFPVEPGDSAEELGGYPRIEPSKKTVSISTSPPRSLRLFSRAAGRYSKPGPTASVDSTQKPEASATDNPTEHTSFTDGFSPYGNYPVGASRALEKPTFVLRKMRFLEHELSRQRQLIAGLRV